MLTIRSESLNKKEHIVLENKSKSSALSICLDEGGRIVDLKLKGKSIIKEQVNFKYKTSYASSILFPFANRIRNGNYTFLGKIYQLSKNENNSNAIHGLVFNKKFQVTKYEFIDNSCSVTLKYDEKSKIKGFPFTYTIFLKYTLSENELKLKITIKNTDTNPFPFTLGWHPYFNCNDFSKAFLKFKSDKKIVFDDKLITKSIQNIDEIVKLELGGKQLDNCFILNTNEVHFITEDYSLKLTSDAVKNYLQLYTPKDIPVIAIEPMTGISDSFNNKIGLQVLNPNKSHTVNWNIKLI
ncbi:aldose 1-epimerase [Polaribacter marinivivus]|uniref:aldose 1-epimerase n=1 Tax=Polaribacter marinivivus TaxID=1524260 RepID=UPI003D357756